MSHPFYVTIKKPGLKTESHFLGMVYARVNIFLLLRFVS